MYTMMQEVGFEEMEAYVTKSQNKVAQCIVPRTDSGPLQGNGGYDGDMGR